jgi:hypothetical protein
LFFIEKYKSEVFNNSDFTVDNEIKNLTLDNKLCAYIIIFELPLVMALSLLTWLFDYLQFLVSKFWVL